MSKKHFIALADALRGTLDGLKAEDRSRVVNALVAFCKAENPRFMEDRWREYLAGKCGPNGGAR